MGIYDSHGEEILFEINTSHGDTQWLGVSGGYTDSDYGITNKNIKLVHKREFLFNAESVFD